MVRPMPIHFGETSFSMSPIPLAIGLFVSVTLVVSLCAKHARRASTKQQTMTMKSPLRTPKQLITTLSGLHAKKTTEQRDHHEVSEESGVWQKAIMMGDKCRPPEFSGVIYYDYSGNQIPEMPKSPRAGSMSPFKNFAYHSEDSFKP